MEKTVPITAVRRRLLAAGIDYRWQGGSVIRSCRCEDGTWREEPLHPDIFSEDLAAAIEAWRVLGEGERLGRRWQDTIGQRWA